MGSVLDWKIRGAWKNKLVRATSITHATIVCNKLAACFATMALARALRADVHRRLAIVTITQLVRLAVATPYVVGALAYLSAPLPRMGIVLFLPHVIRIATCTTRASPVLQ